MDTCNACPINSFGVCSSALYVNPHTDEIRTTSTEGFYRGCGCLISSKIKNPNKSCPAGKW